MTSNASTGTKTHGKFVSLAEEGTSFREMPTGLSYLKSLGVTHIQLMPVAYLLLVTALAVGMCCLVTYLIKQRLFL
jgi:pullulanase/glycogen debranching enzyme